MLHSFVPCLHTPPLVHGLHVLVMDEGVEAGVEGGQGINTFVTAYHGLPVGLAGSLISGHLTDDCRHFEDSKSIFLVNLKIFMIFVDTS